MSAANPGSGCPGARQPRPWWNMAWTFVAGAAAIAVSASAQTTFAPRLVWNASPSSPVGLYAVEAATDVRPGDLVVAWPPPASRRLAAVRHYLPLGVPLVKRVAAAGGDRVCGRDRHILINGRKVADRRARDPRGRPMPSWSGCRKLHGRELFLLSQGVSLAFDGRYFGVTRPSEVVGRARALWVR